MKSLADFKGLAKLRLEGDRCPICQLVCKYVRFDANRIIRG